VSQLVTQYQILQTIFLKSFSIHSIFDLIFVKKTRNLSIAMAETKNGIANPKE